MPSMHSVAPSLTLGRAVRWLVVLAVAATGCAGRPATVASSPVRPQIVIPSRQGTGPFSGAVRVGNLLFLSGQIGTDSTGGLAKGGTAAETYAALRIIDKLLVQAGSSMDRVAKCTVMIADMKDWAAMNEVYIKFFPKDPPARSSFGANGLALGAHVEIECIAAID